jgi:pimeloyl-ACP methyl ester carboxylesterase
MPATSSLARLQQGLVAGLLLAASLWLAAWWSARPVLAVAGALAILFAHVIILGLEFLILVHVRRGDPTPPASAMQLVLAWVRESIQDVRVFGWRQPFRWRRWPDHLEGSPGRRGIVFVHGFICNRGIWTPWLARARAGGHPFAAVNLEPVFGSIDDYVRTLDAAVRRVRAASGQPPVLVCHSMGGLAARAWLRRQHRAGAVAHVVTIGTPHHGTWLARFSRVPNGRQMRMDGEWLRDVGTADPEAAKLFTCWYGNCDNVVLPPSTATLAGADNRLVEGAAHVDLAFRPEVVEGTFALVQAL